MKDIVSMINTSEFKEDINMNLINQKEKFWDTVYEKNKLILNYFKESKPGVLDNLRERFVSTINTLVQNLLSQKVIWSDFLKESLISIQKKINELYIEMFNKCEYQEDIDKYIKKNDILYNNIINEFKEKYFQNLSENRFNEAKEKIKNICKEEYNKILNNKLPVWNSIKKDICARIKEKLESYLFKIFNGKTFKDEIELNLGKKEAFINVIPLDIKENNQIKKSKEREIFNFLENEAENAITLFNNQRNELPLFKEYMENKIQLCTNIADNKIKELLSQFHYFEDAIKFNSDSFFYLLTSNQEIYKNCGDKIKEINEKIRELCNEKSKEYDSKILKEKPKWTLIKSEKMIKIKETCENFEKKLFENAYFQEDIEDVDINKLKLLIMELPDLYKEVESDKKEEINSEINKYINKICDKIISKKNTLNNWSMIETQLIQQAIIEMTNKSKSDLGSPILNNIITALYHHIETIPNFFDECKTEEKKKDLREKIKKNATPIAEYYVEKRKEEERIRAEERS